MKIYYFTSVAASGISLVLSIVLFGVGLSNQTLQAEVQKKQQELQKQEQEIEKGRQIQGQLGPKLLQDMANVALKDENMKALLKKHGYDLKPPESPAPSAATPAPGAAAPAAPAPRSPASDATGLRPQ